MILILQIYDVKKLTLFVKAEKYLLIYAILKNLPIFIS